MKKSIYFFTVLMSLALFTGCSSDNDSTNSNNENYQKLLGKWYFDDPIANPIANNSFTFVSNGNVTYSYWTGVDNEYDSETGTFTVQNNILTMVFPETVSITFVQEVVFINNKVVQFIQAEGSNEEPYDGTYYKL